MMGILSHFQVVIIRTLKLNLKVVILMITSLIVMREVATYLLMSNKLTIKTKLLV